MLQKSWCVFLKPSTLSFELLLIKQVEFSENKTHLASCPHLVPSHTSAIPPKPWLSPMRGSACSVKKVSLRRRQPQSLLSSPHFIPLNPNLLPLMPVRQPETGFFLSGCVCCTVSSTFAHMAEGDPTPLQLSKLMLSEASDLSLAKYSLSFLSYSFSAPTNLPPF